LRVHADFRRHITYNLQRRLNLLLYMNEDWTQEYGGHLELWDPQMTACVRRILPVANRCVIFNTSARSFHGHPRPLTCPEGRLRQSIALYYYTADPAREADDSHHATNWQELPEERGQSDA
jgi:Rps23 Pro-64 3,4-dihydroxylase Tpa1-like proline 4-hydroxylase